MKRNIIKDFFETYHNEFIMFLVSIFVIGAFSFPSFLNYQNKRTITATVTYKEVKRKSDNDKYLVFVKTEDGENTTYQITDLFFAGEFNSSDRYGSIEIGETYEFTLTGYRNGFFSMYPCIREADIK